MRSKLSDAMIDNVGAKHNLSMLHNKTQPTRNIGNIMANDGDIQQLVSCMTAL